ncbi:unnamed protein product, partial [Brassica rapa subsp. trilocularis]
FDGKDTTPLETIQLAKSEAKSWRLAQVIEKPQDEDAENEHHATPPPKTDPICLTDASWHKDDNLFGEDMVLITEDGTTTY